MRVRQRLPFLARARRLGAVALATGLIFPLLQGCNSYGVFRLAGLAQEDFTNDAELLFVIDNSTSMREESADLAVNFDGFIDKLINPAGSGELNGLADAVDNYILGVGDRGSVVDFQLGITTTDAGQDFGRLVSFNQSQPVIPKGTPDTALKFNQNLLCESTCFTTGSNGDLPGAADVGREGYTCGDPLGSDQLFFEYMNCTCGDNAWKGNCGSGTEEHLESIFLAMCRSLDPADDSLANQTLLLECEDRSDTSDDNYGTPFRREEHAGTNADFFREGSVFIPVIVTDAGDNSRRSSTGESEAEKYTALYDAFGRRMSVAVISRRVEECQTGGSDSTTAWQVQRYDDLVDAYDGIFLPITQGETSEDCEVADFGEALERVGDLLNQLTEIFPLQAIPDQETILVFVDGKRVDPAPEERDEDGNITLGDGWSYLAAENGIQFHGEAIPDFSQKVRIYYLPLDGMPRTLPF